MVPAERPLSASDTADYQTSIRARLAKEVQAQRAGIPPIAPSGEKVTGAEVHPACSVSADNVFGHNCIVDGVSDARQAPAASAHGAEAGMNLWEGSYGVKALGNWTYGSASHSTLLRGRLVGRERSGLGDPVAVSLELNVIGNVLGTWLPHHLREG